MLSRDVAAFIGPEGPTCHTAAMVAASQNRAMTSYKCSDASVSKKDKFPTFTRMEPPDTQVFSRLFTWLSEDTTTLYFQITNSVLTLLRYYRWDKFSILCEQGAQFETIAKHLKIQALEKNFTLNHDIIFDFSDPGNTSKRPHDILKETKDSTRIYVFLGKI